MKKKIGVFDSGFGGIHILRSIIKTLPQYDYVYLGDNARAPYGNRTPEMVHDFTRQAVEFLFDKHCDLVILACYTAATIALRKIQQEYLPYHAPHKRVLGVFVPAVEDILEQSKNKKVGVIATAATVASGAFVKEVNRVDASIQVYQQACPLLVPLVEEGEEKSVAAELILNKYLKPLVKKRIDTLVLGCTHYGFLEKKIRQTMGPEVIILSGEREVPPKVALYLKNHPEIESKLSRQGTVTFYSTDVTSKFSTLGSRFFGQQIQVQKVVL